MFIALPLQNKHTCVILNKCSFDFNGINWSVSFKTRLALTLFEMKLSAPLKLSIAFTLTELILKSSIAFNGINFSMSIKPRLWLNSIEMKLKCLV